MKAYGFCKSGMRVLCRCKAPKNGGARGMLYYIGFCNRVPFTGSIGFYNRVPFKGTVDKECQCKCLQCSLFRPRSRAQSLST